MLNRIVKGVIVCAAIHYVAPLAITAIDAVTETIHKKKIKKGLKEGSIVIIDGQYCEVKVI